MSQHSEEWRQTERGALQDFARGRMKAVVSTWILLASVACGFAGASVWAEGNGGQQSTVQAASPEQDAASLTPPPAYTPRPKDAPPVEDTPAQRDALAKWKARAIARVEQERKSYNAEVSPSYDYHYGKGNPFTPGNIQVQGEGFLQPGAFPNAEYCGTCHQEAYSQWRQALHSNAFRTPFYRTSVNLLIRDKTRGIAFARHCDSCHNPIGVLGAALTEDSRVDRAKFDSDGLTARRVTL